MKAELVKLDFCDVLTDLKRELESVEGELDSLPKGTLYRAQVKDRKVYNWYAVQDDNTVKKLGITRNKELLMKLSRKGFLEKKKDVLYHNIKVIEYITNRIFGEYISLADDNIVSMLPRRYDSLPREYLLGEIKQNGWGGMTFEQSDYMPDEKKHNTVFGFKVRSKSEALIVQLFHEYGIEFRYEQVFFGVDGERCIPDFTIRRKRDGKIFYWEHCGLPSDSDYMRRHKQKIMHYERNGIVPWDNLIVTYDGACGDIDLQIIRAEIEGKLL